MAGIDRLAVAMPSLHVVSWRGVFRVMTEQGTVAAVCETLEEAEAYIAGQVEPEELP